MARKKIKRRSYKNASNLLAETSPEPENMRAESPAQEVPDCAPPEEDCFPLPLIRSPPHVERPPDPSPELEKPQSPPSSISEEDVFLSGTTATVTSIRATNGHTSPVCDQFSTSLPGSPVNLSRHSPTPGCSRDSAPFRYQEPQPSTSYHRPRPCTSYEDRDTPSPQPSTSYACDIPSTSYHRPHSPIEPVPGCSRDYYPQPGTSSMPDHIYNSCPSSPVNLSWNSPIPGCSRDSGYQPRPSTSRDLSRMSLSPPLGMTIWDSMKENCQQRANAAAADYRPRTPDTNAVPPVDEIFSPHTQREIRSSIRNLFPNGPPPLPLIKPMRRPKKGDVPYIVGCTKRPRVPSPTCLTVFQGDKYGITSETNVDGDNESTPAKRGRRNPGIPGYSKSRFNAQSDDIASRLKLHEKIDSLLNRGSGEPSQEEPVGYVTKRSIPPRKFSPLPSTSFDRETIMKNDRHFCESLGRHSDIEEDDDDDELPEIVWGSRTKYEETRSRNVSPMDINENTNNDSQGDDNRLIINEDNNNYSPIESDNEIQFDKYIPKEKLVESSDVIVEPKREGELKIVETIDLQDGYSKPPEPATHIPTGDVICIDDAEVPSKAENQNYANGNVIDLLDSITTQTSNNEDSPVLRSNKMPNATGTQSDLVIEVPDTNNEDSPVLRSNNVPNAIGTQSGLVIEVPDANNEDSPVLRSNNVPNAIGTQSDIVIEVPDANNEDSPVLRSNNVPNAIRTQSDLVIEVPDANNEDSPVLRSNNVPNAIGTQSDLVIEVPDANNEDSPVLRSNNVPNAIGTQSDLVIEVPDANNEESPVLRSNNVPNATTVTQSNLVIEVPDAEDSEFNNNTFNSSHISTFSYPDVQFVSETRLEPGLPSDVETQAHNIVDVQIISCDGENVTNSRPRSNELLNELHSWFSMLTDSCERRLSAQNCRSRSKKNSPNRENRDPATLSNNVSNPTPETSQPAPTAEPSREPSNGKKLGDCPICLDSLSASLLASTNCGHVFCLDCIKKSLSTTGKKCPTCRKQLKGAGYHQVFL